MDGIDRTRMASRCDCAPEDLELPDDSLKGECTHCNGVVLVPRVTGTFHLQADAAWCCFCGQRYRVTGTLITMVNKSCQPDPVESSEGS